MKYLFLILLLFDSYFLLSQRGTNNHYDSFKIIEEADSLYRLDQYENSYHLYNKVTKTDPNYLYAVSQKIYSLNFMEDSVRMDSIFKDLDLENLYVEYPELYIQKAIMLSDLARYSESVVEFQKAEEFMPYSSYLNYNWAILHIRMEEYEKSIERLKISLTYNPNHSSSHYLLGLLALDNGRISEAALALMGYLLLSPQGEMAGEAIAALNQNFGNDYLNVTAIKFSKIDDDFTELTEILRSKIPLNKNYKLKTKIDERYTRQIQAVLEYCSSHQVKEGFFENTYIPIFKRIYDKNLTESFLLFTLQGFESQLGKKITAEKKKINAFIPAIQAEDFNQLFQTRKIDHFGQIKKVMIWYENGFPSYVGEYHPEFLHGKVKTVNNHFQLVSELNFEKGRLEGLQKYYTVNVGLREEKTFKNNIKEGLNRFYYPNGNIEFEQIYAGDKLTGKFVSYSVGGSKLCELSFVNDKINGLRRCYFADGSLSILDSMVMGVPTGEIKYYNANGDLISSYFLDNNELNGEFIQYYNGSQILSEGNYIKDKAQGNVNFYFPNGLLKRKNEMKNGVLIKSSEYYDNGNLNSESIYSTQEEIQSIINYDFEGRKVNEDIFVDGKINKTLQFFPDSETFTEIDLQNQKFTISNLINKKIIEGQFKDGQKEGKWITYHPSGVVESITTYKEGKATGLKKEYSYNHKTEYIYHILEDVISGEYNVYLNDIVFLNKFTKDDENHGPYKYFYPNTISYEGFHINGKEENKKYSYRQDGSLLSISKYIDNEVYQTSFYNTENEVEFLLDFKDLNGPISIPRYKNNTTIQNNYIKGKKYGISKTIEKNDTPISEYFYKNDVLFGPSKTYHPNGKLQIETAYYNGKFHGNYKNYDCFGKLRFSTSYKFGDIVGPFERFYHNSNTMYSYSKVNGSTHGNFDIFNFDGKLVARIIYYQDTPIKYQVLNDKDMLGEVMEFEDGIHLISKYSNGQKAFEVQIKDLMFEDKFIIYNDEGSKSYECDYSKNEIEGTRIEYYKNGNIYKKENLINGNFHGIQEYFEESGQLLLSLEFSEDEMHGNFKAYKNGELIQHKIYNSNELVEIRL